MATDGQVAFRQLRAVYPLLMAATASCLIGAMLSLHTVRRRRRFPVSLGAGSALAAVLAVVLFARSFGSALRELQDLATGTGGTLGTMELTAAVLLCLTATFLAGRNRPGTSAAL